MKAHLILPNNAGKSNGGGKVMIRMAEVLQELGYDTTLEFNNGTPPLWLDIRVPIRSVTEADLVIVCEVSFGWIGKVKGFNLVYYQTPSHIDRDDDQKPITYKSQGAQGVFFNSEWNRQRYFEATGEDGPVVYPSVDLNLFHPRAKADFKKALYFPRKNLGMASKAIEKIKNDDFNIEWFAVDNLHENKLAEIWSNYGISMITGYPESFSLPPLEAMASGSVPVGAAGGAGREFMTHGVNSLVVDDGDWEALAMEIENVYGNEEKLNQLREAGLQTAQKFSVENQKQQLIQALKSLGAPCL